MIPHERDGRGLRRRQPVRDARAGAGRAQLLARPRPDAPGSPDRAALRRALRDALTLRYLDGGGGDGCTYPGEAPSQARRWFHHLTFYGFLLCFASTTLATFCHYALGWQAPYAWFHPVVVLGTLGGARAARRPGRPALAQVAGGRRAPAAGHGRAFTVLLLLTSLTGLAAARAAGDARDGRAARGASGIVLGLFLALPYSQFVHALYRSAALLRYALERHRGRAFELQ